MALVLPPGMTQVDWQFAAVELHRIMQLVTVEVTVDRSGVIGVGDCAEAMPPLNRADENAAIVNSIAPGRMRISSTDSDGGDHNALAMTEHRACIAPPMRAGRAYLRSARAAQADRM
jgi:hypothetical protein